MQRVSKFVAAAVTLATWAYVPSTCAQDISGKLHGYAGTLQRARSQLAAFNENEIAWCREDIATARAEGTPADFVLEGSMVTTDVAYASVEAFGRAGLTKIDVLMPGMGTPDSFAVADIESRFCTPLRKATAEYGTQVVAADEASRKWWDEAAAPYRELGMDGDKLEFVVGNTGRAIRRYQFDGNNLVGKSSADYLLRPGPGANQ